MTQSTDTLPWYRQFWPWFIIGLLATMVIISFALLAVALKEPFSMVNKDYYQEGLTINRNMKERKRAADLGVQATLTFRDDRRIQVALTSVAPLEIPALQLQFDHPIDDAQDINLDLSRLPSGQYQSRTLTVTELRNLHAGAHWYVYLYADRGTQIEWFVQGEFAIGNGSTIALHASDR